jgi:UDP-glucose 4-epimerase
MPGGAGLGCIRKVTLMKVVVTGGAGFIGGNLCRMLTAHPDITEVVALDNLATGFESNLDGVDARLVIGSILEPSDLDACFEGAGSVVHLGARPSVPRSVADPGPSHEANATGTLNVLEAARRAGGLQVITASSSSVYGGNPVLPKTEDLSCRPLSPYAASKLASESYTLAWQASYGLPTLAFRFFNVFGPLQPPRHAYSSVVPAFLAAAFAGVPLPVHGDGLQSRDFTYVDTVCAVLVDAVVRRVSDPDPINLAYGTKTNLLELVAALETILDRPLAIGHEDARIGDMRHTQADNTRLRQLFPEIEALSLDEGLRRTVEWFESRPDLHAGVGIG